MSIEEISYMPAHEMAKQFIAKTLSPVEVMNSLIAHIEVVNQDINAVSHSFFDESLNLAKKSEERYLSGKPGGPLDGIPVAIKDESFIAGMPCTKGSIPYKDYIATSTSPYNQRILDAGGIPHIRTTTPEFSCSGVTWSKLHGVTRNPWNREFTPGGSSGGAGACLASGMA